MSRKDDLLGYELASQEEIESFRRDADATKEGRLEGVVGSDLWHRVMAEMTRRQVNAQIRIAKSLTRATWALALATLGLIAATVWLTLIHG